MFCSYNTILWLFIVHHNAKTVQRIAKERDKIIEQAIGSLSTEEALRCYYKIRKSHSRIRKKLRQRDDSTQSLNLPLCVRGAAYCFKSVCCPRSANKQLRSGIIRFNPIYCIGGFYSTSGLKSSMTRWCGASESICKFNYINNQFVFFCRIWIRVEKVLIF